MTWNRLHDSYILKFRLNLHKKFRGIPSGADLDSEFLQNQTYEVTKKNVLSVACQFYDPTGLAAPLMVSVQQDLQGSPVFYQLCLVRGMYCQIPTRSQ